MCQQLTGEQEAILKKHYELLGQSNDSNWDTTAITPGTQFMEELGKQIKLY